MTIKERLCFVAFTFSSITQNDLFYKLSYARMLTELEHRNYVYLFI